MFGKLRGVGVKTLFSRLRAHWTPRIFGTVRRLTGESRLPLTRRPNTPVANSNRADGSWNRVQDEVMSGIRVAM